MDKTTGQLQQEDSVDNTSWNDNHIASQQADVLFQTIPFNDFIILEGEDDRLIFPLPVDLDLIALRKGIEPRSGGNGLQNINIGIHNKSSGSINFTDNVDNQAVDLLDL